MATLQAPVLVSVLALAACAPAEGDRSSESDLSSQISAEQGMTDPIEQAQARVTRKVIDLEGVTGTAMGLCDGQPCIKVYIEKNSSALRARLPKSESGVPVVVEVSGTFRRP